MKKHLMTMLALSLFCLCLGTPAYCQTQQRPVYLDQPVQVKVIGEINPGEKYPLLIFLPFTTGSADKYFSFVSPHTGLDNYIAVIPHGTAQLTDYLPDFYSYMKWYEKRLMTDLPEILKAYPVDRNRIYISGYSLGGDLSWALLIRQKELFAGALIIGSRCSYVPNSKDLKYLKQHGRRFVLLMGDRDLPDRAKGMDNAARLAKKNGLAVWHQQFQGAHDIPNGQELRKAFDLLTDSKTAE